MQDFKISEITIRVIIDALKEVLGENGKNAILKYSKLDDFIDNPPSYIEDETLDPDIPKLIHGGINHIIGQNGARAISYRAGRMLLRIGVIKSDKAEELIKKDKETAVKVLLDVVCYQARRTDAKYTWHDSYIEVDVPGCAVCDGIKSKEPYCHFWRGILEELMFITRGVEYEVKETECKAKGDDSCVFHIFI